MRERAQEQDIYEINLRHGSSANVGGNTRSVKAGACKQEGRHEAATLLTQSLFEISAADRARPHKRPARNDGGFIVHGKAARSALIAHTIAHEVHQVAN